MLVIGLDVVKWGRIDIPVAVSSNIAPERVVEILLEIASTTEGVLKTLHLR